MSAAVAALVAAAATLVVTVIVVRAHAARRLGRLTGQLDPNGPPRATLRLGQAFEQVERAAERAATDTASHLELMAQLQAATEALPLGIVVIDQREQVLARNRAAVHFLGIPYADALVEEAVRANLRVALRGEASAQTLELHGPPRRSVLVRAIPVDAEGSNVAISLIEDVSERSRLEAMRTDFVANISHELRTPVGALALLAETMVDEDDPALVRRLAAKMVIESGRVARIMEDLLELSRLEHDGRPHAEVVPVGRLAAEAVDRVRALADQRGIDVVVEEPSRRLSVLGDRRQLVSALANLIENGVKYSDTGQAVEVIAHTDGQWVELVVADHGIGIPARDQDRIFERFYRVDRARSRDTGGTGLGLAIVRHVATNHGGTVAVQSSEGEGSAFTIRIPAGPGPLAVTLSEAG